MIAYDCNQVCFLNDNLPAKLFTGIPIFPKGITIITCVALDVPVHQYLLINMHIYIFMYICKHAYCAYTYVPCVYIYIFIYI